MTSGCCHDYPAPRLDDWMISVSQGFIISLITTSKNKGENPKMSTALVPALDMKQTECLYRSIRDRSRRRGSRRHGRHRRKAGALQGPRRWPNEFGSNLPPRRRPMSAICASGWLPKRRAATSPTMKRTDKFSLSEEQAFTLANEDSPAYLPGAFELALGSLAAVPRIAGVFPHWRGNGLA